MRTSHSSTNTTPSRAVTAERTTWTTCNWYTGGATMRTMRGPGTGRQRLEPDDEQSSRPVLRGLGLGNEARLPDTCWSRAAVFRLVVGFLEAPSNPEASAPVWAALVEVLARLPTDFGGCSGVSAGRTSADFRACSI